MFAVQEQEREMRTVYATQFQVEAGDDESPESTLARIRSVLTEWARERLQLKWGIEAPLITFGTDVAQVYVPAEAHRITTSTVVVGDVELSTLDWSHPHSDDSTTWMTWVTAARDGAIIEVAIQVRLESREFDIRPVSFLVGRPKAFDGLASSVRCVIDGHALRTSALVVGVEGVDELVAERLLNARRVLPIVVVTLDTYTERSVIDADRLQIRLLGQAFVIQLRDKWTAFRLTEALGRSLTCHSGAVRLYWPGLSLSSNPYDHPLYMPARLAGGEAGAFEERLFRLLNGLASFRFKEGPHIRKARELIQAQRAAEIERLRTDLAMATVPEEWERELERAWDQEGRLKNLLDEKELRIQELTEELETQKQLWVEHRGWYETADQTEERSVEESGREFRSVVEAVEAARAQLTGEGRAILFLSRVTESAADSPYQQPAKVYELLTALSQVAERWKASSGQLGPGGWKAALEEHGFQYRPHISQTTRTRWGDEYTYTYEGERILFEEHVTLGAGDPNTCASVHWFLDKDRRHLVIGHCGRHLSNTTT